MPRLQYHAICGEPLFIWPPAGRDGLAEEYLISESGDLLLKDWSDNPVFIDAPIVDTTYGLHIRCSSDPSCTTQTDEVVVSQLVTVACPDNSTTMTGVTPLGRTSGKSLDTAQLTQGSNKRVLNALYRSSVVAIKHSAIDRAYYTKKLGDYAGHPKPTVAAFIALSRQRHKVIFKLMTTDARYDKEILIKRHLERLDEARKAAA